MLSIDVRVDGALLKAGNANAIVEREMTAAMHASTQHLRGLIMPKTPVGVSGTLRGGTQAKVTGSGADRTIEGRVFNPSAYGMPVELGRRPGKQPPSSALELWVRRKLGVPENRVKSVAFLVARKIGRKGTTAVRMFAQAVNDGRSTVNALFDRAAGRIASELGK